MAIFRVLRGTSATRRVEADEMRIGRTGTLEFYNHDEQFFDKEHLIYVLSSEQFDIAYQESK